MNKQHSKINKIVEERIALVSSNKYIHYKKHNNLLFSTSSSISASNNSNQECSSELRNLLGFNGFTFNWIVAKKIAATAICNDGYWRQRVVRKLEKKKM